MAGKRSVRGEMNVILNRLTREGVIARFEIKQDSPLALVSRLRICVVPGAAANPDAAKRAVISALGRFSEQVSVRVKADDNTG